MPEVEEHEVVFTADGVERRTFYYARGPTEGPLLVFLHGFPAIAASWKSQLATFASLGFRVVAPDLPGYGRSTARKVAEDYSLESVHQALNVVFDHIGAEKAVWIGHDWGAVVAWSYAQHFPERCVGVAGLAIPSHVMERGFDAALETVNRDIYPEDKYPFGQWAYQHYFKTHFEKVVKWFESDVETCLPVMYMKGSPEGLGKVSPAASVGGEGELFGGEKPDPAWRQVPKSMLCADEEYLREAIAASKKSSFWGPVARYLNHERNEKYFESAKNGGKLHMPALFIAGSWDSGCDVVHSSVAEPGRRNCTNLTETSVKAGHWVVQERPEEVNAAIIHWLVKSCEQHWPSR
ncbi:hypothetical protein M409DRAFT_25302 [Zasmidium cellare ATCC 36951]|uniref:AB hydrolase-1 domain-containing protein n=1 Tax=Zasmidium cellare ATCC 36951 TaxID=1080233 RepID=A0A6A6CBJ8_ZASCE|nr:uncharacterized protein M409DRAFT_25302 [Zasmidium cellare ATCC 36951]KAF2164425.1 hypothetical protein M409DRAFT_25302 [Zasmidium cellare ATCC 36951]